MSLLGVTFIASGLLQLSGDPVALMFQSGVADPAQVEALRHDLMLDRPMAVQFAGFVSQMAQGDLGESLRFRRPAAELIFERLPATLLLAAVAMAFALLVAIPSAIASAVRPRDHIVALFGRMVVLIGQSVPLFWLGYPAGADLFPNPEAASLATGGGQSAPIQHPAARCHSWAVSDGTHLLGTLRYLPAGTANCARIISSPPAAKA